MIIKMNVSKDEYIKMPGLSRSGIVQLMRGPNWYKDYIDNPKSSPAMRLGTALHDAFLTPDYFKEHYIFAPEGMKFNNKEGIDFKKQNAGKEILNAKDGYFIKSRVEALNNHPSVQRLFQNSIIEPCATWIEDGVHLKTMPDIVNKELGIISDLKTIADFSDSGMEFAIKNFGLHIQGALATEALKIERFVLIFISKIGPAEIECREIYSEEIMRAKELYREQLPIYKECVENNFWPSKRSTGIIPIGLPVAEARLTEEDYYETY